MIQTLHDDLFKQKRITVDVLRLDLLHPEVSGNKWFKLKYHLSDAIAQQKTGLLSFGGAYSNHLVAMAFVCKSKAMASTAIIRGDEADLSNPSIEQMKQYGMELIFVSRKDYVDKEQLRDTYLSQNPGYYYVPEGGQSVLGVKGASEILNLVSEPYTDILCAVGTGTTMAGLMKGAVSSQKITGICSLKVKDPQHNALTDYLQQHSKGEDFKLLHDYHFGGYAKKNAVLTTFMNHLYRTNNMATDFVYTGKLFYALYDLAKKDFFYTDARVLVIHSGGLQGNRSLPEGVLDF